MIKALLDTSDKHFLFAIYQNDICLNKIEKYQQIKSDEILPEIKVTLNNTNLEFKNIDEWLVGNGPGSFTGIRSSMAFVKGLVLNSNKKISAINSGYLYLPEEKHSQVNILHDARQNEVIINSFKLKNNTYVHQENIKIVKIDSLENRDNQILITSMPLEKFQNNITKINYISNLNLKNFLLATPYKNFEPLYARDAVFPKQVEKS